MSESTKRPSTQQPAAEQPTQPENQTDQSEETPVDTRDLVYRGGYSGDPREIIENPAVTPEMLEQAPEDLRDDLMPKGDND